ncbi:class IV adenylate cyclase [Shewanella sp. Choline-02u-19]|uniref:class IV adenylate cyclase n=2 Tax=Shewanella TaxID=22 RepID=UPI000C334E11|nr:MULTISPECIES: class IV adenylate cyclase [unclassified Shewanella]PKG76157.1 class IV adenylate cyclase [Shewanella sp. GutCb]PKI30109.1 class IV adenylate cyclase [Shewanella sp. Choline-02u-19]
MTEHFEGKFEVELKYRIASKSQFLVTLNSMEHEIMLQDNLESDCYFDTSEQQLLAENKSLCIREMEPSGIKLWIVKGPEADRCEATNITDANKAKSMLKTMGYHVVLAMKKTRSIYFVGKFHMTVDNLDGLGDFAEFAIMTDEESLLESYRSELITLASKFGLSSTDLEHRSYRKIYSESLTV